MILTKLGRILYEIDYKDKLDTIRLPFDKLIERLAQSSKEDKDFILSRLDEETKQKVNEMIEGGLL